MKKLTTMQRLILELAKANNTKVYVCPTHNVFTNTKGNICPYCEKECSKYEE